MASVVGCIIRVIPNLHIALSHHRHLHYVLGRFGGCQIIPSNASPTAPSLPKRYQVTVAISDLNFGYGGFLCESRGIRRGKCR